MQVFLSYARGDATSEADQLRELLDNTGVHSWVDRHDLVIGENWWPGVRKAIVSADTFALLITPGSMASEEVKREYSLALQLKKDFVPLLFKQAAKPPEIDTIQHIDMTGSGYVNGITKLIGRPSQRGEELRATLRTLHSEPIGANGWTAIPEELIVVANKLEEHTHSKIRPPEVFLAFYDLLQQFRDRAALQAPLLDALEEFLNDGVAPPEWKYVVEEHRSYFCGLLEPVRKRLQPQRTGKPVPVVLVVMTKAEAQELADGTALADAPPDVVKHFEDLKLPGNWVDAYGATPEQWIPFPGSDPIGAQIRGRIQKLSVPARPLYADFLDIRRIHALPFEQLRKLRYEGCLVVMDVLSIFHPKLQQEYLRSMLCAQEKALLVQMLPWVAFPELRDVTITFKKRLDLEFWERYESSDNCKQIDRPVDLKRFLEGELAGTSGVFAFIHPQ